MKNINGTIIAFFIICSLQAATFGKKGKERVIILTDFGDVGYQDNVEQDDEQSMVRFLLYSNEWDIEGLVATRSGEGNEVFPNSIKNHIDKYALVRNNLLKHASGYPTAEHLKSKVAAGQPGWMMENVGEEFNSTGAELIIAAVDKDDPRPVWVCIWGGSEVMAQVLWMVKKTRSKAEVDKFVAKLRVYEIGPQDNTGAWILHNFPDIFWIRSYLMHRAFSNWGPKKELITKEWYRTNVQENHGPLGAVYPNRPWEGYEGDTPSFLYLIPNGLSSPEQPEWGSWGGRFEYQENIGPFSRHFWGGKIGEEDVGGSYSTFFRAKDTWQFEGKTYTGDSVPLIRWREAYQNDFQARMDWTIKPFDEANHNPVVACNSNKGKDIIEITAGIGQKIDLSAEGTTDPDGDEMTYNWYFYREPSSYKGTLNIENTDSINASFITPEVDMDKTIHIILTVKDNGEPNLYSYRRIIITVSKEKSLIFTSESYKVYSDRVTDEAYKATAYSADGSQIYSEVMPNYRMTGDPERDVDLSKVHPGNLWKPVKEIDRFPTLNTGHKIVDAVYKNALDILYRCSSGEFLSQVDVMTGKRVEDKEKGMWQAGFCNGYGYGVWTRDACYIGMLMGSILDRYVAKKTLSYITRHGTNNGEDGNGLPPVAIWDYFLATGDTSIIKENYNHLKLKVLDIKYDADKKLGYAGQSTFMDNDRKIQIKENDGFAFSTNVVYKEAYRTMALMGEIMGESEIQIREWKKRSNEIKASINEKYWKASAGYYTNGPKGSLGYKENYWETGGTALAVWPKWGIADSGRRVSILNSDSIAWTEFGYSMRPFFSEQGEKPINQMYGHERWIHSEVGLLVAAAHEKRIDKVWKIWMSIVRDVAMNKTFMELINTDSGISWRYPGQLWHATGFISMLYYGMLGMEYDEQGLTFNYPCVPKEMENFSIQNFQYRNAVLDISVNGWGFSDKLLLDGKQVNRIPAGLTGKHKVELVLSATGH